jgi:antirestriction protein ArdC
MTAKKNYRDVLNQLETGIAALTSSERWQQYLEFQSRFHRYSFNNALLIATQYPAATQIAGFTAWKKVGRSVRKGERAIWILAPIRARQLESESDSPVIHGFRSVPVFDLSQTEGDDVPVICRQLDGEDGQRSFALLAGVAAMLGFSVDQCDLPQGVNGDCSHSLGRIRVAQANATAQQVKTLSHELAHALLHETFSSRSLAELEAESTAYVICQALGLDTGAYSFGYVTTWAGDGVQAIRAIRSSGTRIQKTADTVLSAMGMLGADVLEP